MSNNEDSDREDLFQTQWWFWKTKEPDGPVKKG